MSDMPLPLFSTVVVTALVGLMIAYSLIWERGPRHSNPLLWEDDRDGEDCRCSICTLERLSQAREIADFESMP